MTAAQRDGVVPLAQLHVLRHALGMSYDGRGFAYRNHFVTSEGTTDFPHCEALVKAGHMVRIKGSELTGGSDCFMVTETGRRLALAARTEQPE